MNLAVIHTGQCLKLVNVLMIIGVMRAEFLRGTEEITNMEREKNYNGQYQNLKYWCIMHGFSIYKWEHAHTHTHTSVYLSTYIRTYIHTSPFPTSVHLEGLGAMAA